MNVSFLRINGSYWLPVKEEEELAGIFNQADSSMTNEKERGDLGDARRYNPLTNPFYLSPQLLFTFIFQISLACSLRGNTHFVNRTQPCLQAEL